MSIVAANFVYKDSENRDDFMSSLLRCKAICAAKAAIAYQGMMESIASRGLYSLTQEDMESYKTERISEQLGHK
jgi:hypothetical protein